MNDQSLNYLTTNLDTMKNITELQLHWNDKETKDIQYYQMLMGILGLSDLNKLYIKTDRLNTYNLVGSKKIHQEIQRLLEYKFKV